MSHNTAPHYNSTLTVAKNAADADVHWDAALSQGLAASCNSHLWHKHSASKPTHGCKPAHETKGWDSCQLFTISLFVKELQQSLFNPIRNL